MCWRHFLLECCLHSNSSALFNYDIQSIDVGVYSFSQSHYLEISNSMQCQPAECKVMQPWRRHELGLQKRVDIVLIIHVFKDMRHAKAI